jgi:hypothetical protein
MNNFRTDKQQKMGKRVSETRVLVRAQNTLCRNFQVRDKRKKFPLQPPLQMQFKVRSTTTYTAVAAAERKSFHATSAAARTAIGNLHQQVRLATAAVLQAKN